ncbi:unnamed protein product [Ambrosiozyma monospora]|uniref:Unnamed protein product n=1 Tax=Ambrosiozyma monospora TaxID=43982 RepID=A0ACB5SV18_AMBMO|nr:unnamed protein product [Ambrosiozyma monospora]
MRAHFLLITVLAIVKTVYSYPTPLPQPTVISSTIVDHANDPTATYSSGPTFSIDFDSSSTSEPTTTDYDALRSLMLTFTAIEENLRYHPDYYYTAYPELYSSYESIKSYYFSDLLLPDNTANYAFYEAALSFLTLIPSSLTAEYESYFSAESDFLHTVNSTYLTLNAFPNPETPSLTFYDTSLSVPTSGAYAALYLIAQCKALVDDQLQYGGQYNRYLASKSATSGFYWDYLVPENVLESELKSVGTGLNEYNLLATDYCSSYVGYMMTQLDVPWKARILAAAKTRYNSYSSEFTTPIYVDFKTFKPTGYGHQGLSKGAIAGIVVGCVVFVAILVIAMIVVFEKEIKERGSKN